MRIDYSDMAFPKPTRKKKRKKHKKSILRTKKGYCYLCCNIDGNYRQQYTEEHHVIFGSGQREISEAEGLKVYLCLKHHQEVHSKRETRELLSRIAQKEYEQTHTREEWRSRFKKNYL